MDEMLKDIFSNSETVQHIQQYHSKWYNNTTSNYGDVMTGHTWKHINELEFFSVRNIYGYCIQLN